MIGGKHHRRVHVGGRRVGQRQRVRHTLRVRQVSYHNSWKGCTQTDDTRPEERVPRRCHRGA